MTAQCPAGHASTEADYCSVCGAPMIARSPARPASGAVKCPACGDARADMAARFCEVCRFDFDSGTPGPPPAARHTPLPAPVATPPAPTPARRARWELVVTVDATLDTEPDPTAPPPANEPERVFRFDVDELLAGRRDDTRDIRPEIPLNDPGASRRHAVFARQPDGTITVVDLASANGTKLEGAELVSGVARPLAEGAEVTLGRWTRIRLRGRAP